MQTNSSRTLVLNHLLYPAFYTLGHWFLGLIMPGPGTRRLGTDPVTQNPLNLSKSVTPTLGIMPGPFLPAKITIETVAHNFSSLCLLTKPGASPRHGEPLPLEIHECNKLSFQGQLFSNLVVLPYLPFLHNNKPF